MMTGEDRQIVLAFIMELRRHYLGIVAACDRLIVTLNSQGKAFDAQNGLCYDRNNDDRSQGAPDPDPGGKCEVKTHGT